MPTALLISYSGYPFTPSSLTPDNGLANLAGSLIEEDYVVLVGEFGSVCFWGGLFPLVLSALLRRGGAVLIADAGAPGPEQIKQLRQLNAMVETHQAAQLGLIAEEIVEEVRRLQPDLVGMKLWNGDGFTGSVFIAERLRAEFPDLPIHAGGPQCSWFGEAIYRRTQAFTSLTHGEGEAVIKALAEHAAGKRELASIPGVMYLDGDRVRRNDVGEGLDMNALPEPIYDEAVYPAMAGDEKIKIIVLDDSRGCPYNCAFCMHPIESGHRLRTADASVLVDRMQQATEKYGVTAFRFSGSSTPGDLMADVADEILRREMDVTYTCFGHFRSSRPDHFETMARSGLYAIFFGIESGCQEVLDRAVGKKADLASVKDTVVAAQQAGIFVVASMIVPLPFDTEETIRESLDFLLEVRPDSVPVQFAGVIPPTPWGQHPEEYGFEFDRDELEMIGMEYKIKLLFPPSMWEPLPYTLDGMDYSEFSALTIKFAMDLEQNGILVGVPDDNALIAKCAGMTARDFRDLSRLWCTIGDADAMAEMVAAANGTATAGMGNGEQ